jgi:hypothetical protein
MADLAQMIAADLSRAAFARMNTDAGKH